MADGLMTFGRHLGQPASEMPLRYLLWAASSLATPPECVVEELKRRASLHGSREAVEAAAAVSSLLFKGSTKKAKKRKGKWRRKQIAKHYRQRQAS
jgi:hypothetical protein